MGVELEMALPARLKRLLKSSPATSELADYLETLDPETEVETPTDNTPADDTDGKGE